jgi:hypothetical protein
VERECDVVKGRGALLGPEESGPAHRDESLGVGSVSSGSRLNREAGWVWWLGPALTKLLLVVSLRVCCFPCGMLLVGSGGRSAGFPARILRTV